MSVVMMVLVMAGAPSPGRWVPIAIIAFMLLMLTGLPISFSIDSESKLLLIRSIRHTRRIPITDIKKLRIRKVYNWYERLYCIEWRKGRVETGKGDVFDDQEELVIALQQINPAIEISK